MIVNFWKAPTKSTNWTIDYQSKTAKPRKYKRRRKNTVLSTLRKINDMYESKHINRNSNRHENSAEGKNHSCIYQTIWKKM